MSSRNRGGATLAALAARAIATLTEPGDLVVDPMCGRGEVLAAAVLAGRMAIGIEAEQYWADVARARLARLTTDRPAGFAAVARGCAEDGLRVLGADVAGRVQLILTSPHGGTAVRAPGLRAASTLEELGEALASTLGACEPALRADGLVAVIAWPVHHRGEMADIPTVVKGAAMRAGLRPRDCVGELLVFERADSSSTYCGTRRPPMPCPSQEVPGRLDVTDQGRRGW